MRPFRLHATALASALHHQHRFASEESSALSDFAAKQAARRAAGAGPRVRDLQRVGHKAPAPAQEPPANRANFWDGPAPAKPAAAVSAGGLFAKWHAEKEAAKRGIEIVAPELTPPPPPAPGAASSSSPLSSGTSTGRFAPNPSTAAAAAAEATAAGKAAQAAADAAALRDGGVSHNAKAEALAGKVDALKARLDERQKEFTNSAFGGRLQAMHRAYTDSRSRESKVKKDEAKHEAKVAARREMLRFRDVDNDLDKPILKRDAFLWWTYIKGGTDFAIDAQLERELRFYSPEAVQELRRNSEKLIRGADTLLPSAHPFPTLEKMSRLSAFAGTPAAASSSGRQLDTALGEGDSKDSVTLSRASFRRPTVVFISQLSHSAKGQVDIYPMYHNTLLRHIAAVDPRPATSPDAFDPELPAPRDGTALLVTGLPRTSRLDVLRLRSVDMPSARWVRPMLMKSQARRAPADVAQSTLVGERLVRPFMPTFGLRNFMGQYVILVDHKGYVRWISCGPPDAGELEGLQRHLLQLENEATRLGAH